MGQNDVIEYLRNKRKWLTTSQLSDALGISIGSVRASCMKIRKDIIEGRYDNIQFKEAMAEGKYHIYKYRWNR